VALTEAEAIEECDGWVHKLAGKYARSLHAKYARCGTSFKDLVQVGRIAVLEALPKYDATKGMCFKSYATFFIKKRMQSHVARLGGVVRVPVLERYPSRRAPGVSVSIGDRPTEEDGFAPILSSPASQDDELGAHERDAIVRKVMSSLPPHMREALEMIVVDGHDCRSVAKRVGVSSPQSVVNMTNRTLAILRKRMEKELSRDDL
jgi:RNA polymerase sigma factor (sigma-70 family)